MSIFAPELNIVEKRARNAGNRQTFMKQERKRHIISCMMMASIVIMVLFVFPGKSIAQTNPYKINDELYKDYVAAYKVRTQPECLVMSEKMYHKSRQMNDPKAACLALSIPVAYNVMTRQTVSNFDKWGDRLMAEASKTGYLQYYFFTLSQRVTLLINRSHYLSALTTTKRIKADADKMNSKFGQFTFLRCLAKINVMQGDIPTATEYFKEAYYYCKENLPDQDLVGIASNIANYLYAQRKNDEALAWCDEGMKGVKNKANEVMIAMVKLGVLYGLERTEEFMALYDKYKKDIDSRKDTPIWRTVTVKHLIIQGKYDEAIKVARTSPVEADRANLEGIIYANKGDYRKWFDMLRVQYDFIFGERFANSHWEEMAEFLAAIENDRLALERLTLENANAGIMLRNAETLEKAKKQAAENARTAWRNDSIETERMKTRNAAAADMASANKYKEYAAKTRASKHHDNIIFAGIVALVVLAYSIVAISKMWLRAKEMRRKTEQLRDALEQAKEAQKMQDRFMQDLSYEVRTPLNDVVGFSDFILNTKEKLSEQDRNVISENITKSSDRLTSLVNDLLKKAYDDNTRAAAHAIITLLMMMPMAVHADDTRVSTLHELTEVQKRYQQAKDDGNMAEQCRAMIELGELRYIRFNVKKSVDNFEEALRLMKDHGVMLKSRPAVTVALARLYRGAGNYVKAAELLGEARECMQTADDKLDVETEKAYIAFEQCDSNAFRHSHDNVRTLRGRATGARPGDVQRLNAIRMFYDGRLQPQLDKLQQLCPSCSEMELRHLATMMYINLDDWEKAGQSYIAESMSYRVLRVRVLNADHEAVEKEKGINEMQASNLQLQLERKRLEMEEHISMTSLQSEMAEQINLKLKTNALEKKRLAASVEREKARAEKERQRLKQALEYEQTARHSLYLVILFSMLIAVLTAVYVVMYRRNMKIQQRLNARLDQALKDVEESEKTKKAFIQNMSHEIRTPLNSIVGFSQLILQMGDELDEGEKAEFSKTIRSNADMLTQIVKDMADVTELEGKEEDVQMEETSPRQLCIMAMDTVKHREKDNVPIMLNADIDDSTMVMTNPRRVMQVLINFLTNAIKHTDQGHITIGCNTTENEGYVTFYVADTGEGIPEDKREEVFKRFVKLDTFHQGTGLGLNICRRISERLDARIYVDPQYNTGARFVFAIKNNLFCK